MRIDREFFATFENTIKNDPVNQANYAKGDIAAIEEKIKTELFGKPLAYYNEEKLSKAARVGPPPVAAGNYPQGFRRHHQLQD